MGRGSILTRLSLNAQLRFAVPPLDPSSFVSFAPLAAIRKATVLYRGCLVSPIGSAEGLDVSARFNVPLEPLNGYLARAVQISTDPRRALPFPMTDVHWECNEAKRVTSDVPADVQLHGE